MRLHDRLFPGLKGKWAEVNLNDLYVKEYPEAVAAGGKSLALDPSACDEFLGRLNNKLLCDYTYGGYLEDRAELWRGGYHQPGHTVHLGIDYNVACLIPVYLPFPAKLICLEQGEDQDGGWGGRAVYRDKNGLYWVFAHLEKMEGMPGTTRGEGEVIGQVGRSSFNGNWFPHLHVQCMTRYDLEADGYGNKWELENGTLAANFLNPEIEFAHLTGGT